MTTLPQLGSEIALGSKVEANRLLPIPVRRDLENRRTAEAVMCEKHVFFEHGQCLFHAASGSNHFGRDSRKIAPALAVGFAEYKRDQRGARSYDLQSELPGQIITK